MSRLFQKGLKVSHLRLADALSHEGQLSAAAERLGIAQPAASRLAAEAERIIGAPLFKRVGRGIELTAEGRALAIRASRILLEIDDADREISELRSGMTGRVSIGAVTGPAIEHVLPAVRQVRIALPRIELEVEVGTSDALGPLVLDGHLDLALSRPPSNAPVTLFDIQMISTEPVSIVVRPGHPIFNRFKQKETIPIKELLDFDWVMPARGAILRNTVEAAMLSKGLEGPQKVLNTSSFLLVLASISQTNAIAPVATSVARGFAAPDPHDGTGGLVQILKTDMALEVEEYGILTRKGRILTPAARSVLEVLYDVMRVDHALS